MKNPYELRYDIYNTAKDRLMDRYYQDNGEWQSFQEWKREQEAEGNKVTAIPSVSSRPSYPTHEEILEEAEKIYTFVEQKS
tara:strand:+ start:555 stop:797 length:243 start_codon:yes stop_codon:yes gene_type:complete